MLTEQRYEQILKLLEKEGSITVTEVKELLNISESTVRRDITALHNAGKLVKVFGGAVASDHVVTPQELQCTENYSSCIGKAAYSRICGWVDWTGRVHISGCRNDNRIYAGVLL